ncbi:MAG: hotdog fold thioesterase [Streptosporangiales bacterium]|nr:hotdog fold thioesterase [Streptosporangiales bacterium]
MTTRTIPLGDGPGPFDRLIGLRLTRADADRVEAELPVTEKVLQAHGIVHGGIYCAMIEVTCSVGAAVRTGFEYQVVGISNRTAFHRATRSGTIRVVAKPVAEEDPRHLWQATITDDQDRLIASGEVQLMRLDPPPAP